MFDIGITKLMIVGGIALIVVGPERLPRVARMVGTLVGRAQRYVADVKAEVNRSIELDELKKMQNEFHEAARNLDQGIAGAVGEVHRTWNGASDAPPPGSWQPPPASLVPQYRHPGKKWRLKRSATPRWYKLRQGVRTHTQSGAARVARFRPPGQGVPGAPKF